MPGYFNFFPTTKFNNTLCTNIIAKAKFDQSVKNNLAIFYTYNVQPGERADQIASRYYEDPTLDWLIYMANDITDPYFEWPLSQNDFSSYLSNKYGSIEKALNKIAYYRNNYYNDETILSISSYNSLSPVLKKYFKPSYSLEGNIISYERKELDYFLETNKIIKLNVTSSTGFVEGERIIQNSSSATLASISNDSLIVEKVVGSFTNSTIIGEDSNTSSTISSSSIISQPISDLEQNYWESVSCFTLEDELNTNRQNIKILDKAYVGKIIKDMRDVFK